jgi:hypothetical protein
MKAAGRIAATTLLLGTGACTAVPQASAPPATLPAPPPAGAKGVQIIGSDAKHLIATFGAPRLDIREKTMRKLQFANARCVLDAYLYPTAKSREPVVTYVDARLPAGQDTDTQACAAALAGK